MPYSGHSLLGIISLLGISISLRGPPPRLLRPSGGWVYCRAPEAPLIRGMPTGPYAFLEMPGACGLRPCARTHQEKALCHTGPLGGVDIKYRWGYSRHIICPDDRTTKDLNSERLYPTRKIVTADFFET